MVMGFMKGVLEQYISVFFFVLIKVYRDGNSS